MADLRWLSKSSCRVMGILNVTPDSFSDGGQFLDPQQAVDHALEMQAQGASMIDIGAESTRPGSNGVSAQEQINRLLPVLQALKGRLNIPLSVDTTQVEVARMAAKNGVLAINDTSAGCDDPDMVTFVAQNKIPVVLMHRRGLPKVMQEQVNYDHLVLEVLEFLLERAEAYVSRGLPRQLICLDPGLGFGKLYEHNLELTRQLNRFAATGYAVLYGASRKSFVGNMLQVEDPQDRDVGSLVMALEAARQGASWVRVHAVGSTVQALRVNEALKVA